MGNNYQEYALLKEDDSLEQCILNFWDSLEDEIYPKHFLDSLLQLVDDVETCKEKLIPMDDVMADLKKMYEEKDDD
jgi:ppGpp synthetase/RelA/SpoT-type nucleotidyltranferase